MHGVVRPFRSLTVGDLPGLQVQRVAALLIYDHGQDAERVMGWELETLAAAYELRSVYREIPKAKTGG